LPRASGGESLRDTPPYARSIHCDSFGEGCLSRDLRQWRAVFVALRAGKSRVPLTQVGD